MNANELKEKTRKDIERILEKSGLNCRFPEDLNFDGIPPIQFKDRYTIDYLHSYGQDSPFFMALRERKLLGNFCWFCRYSYATPKTRCMYCGERTKWIELPLKAKVHAFTVCYEGSEKFILKVPYSLAVFEFECADTFFLSQLKSVDFGHPTLDWSGMGVEAHFSAALKNKKHIPTILDVGFEPR